MDEAKCLMNNKVGPYAFSKEREDREREKEREHQNAFFVNPTTIQLMMKAFQPCSRTWGKMSQICLYYI